LDDSITADFNLNVSESSTYNKDINPNIRNSFSTAAFRYGHTLIQGLVEMVDLLGIKQEGKKFFLSDTFMNTHVPDEIVGNYSAAEQILLGLMSQSAQKYDRHITDELTNRLFADNFEFSEGPEAGSDLMSRNIQRGRDHGLPSYVAFYQALDIESCKHVMDCWGKRPMTISESNWSLLEKIYMHPHHIDLIVGGFAEQSFKGGILGATFQKIVGKQFEALRFGDRFFFTHMGVMNSNELNQIRSRTLGDVLCQNTQISKVRDNVFRKTSPLTRQCQDSTTMEISQFEIFLTEPEILTSECLTQSGPKVGVPCVIPFTYQGVTYNGCTNDHHNTFWCSTNTTSNGVAISGHWGNCNSDCNTECNGGDSCCRADNKCEEGEGDCDSNNDCQSGLECGENNCVGDGFDDTDDCCFVNLS